MSVAVTLAEHLLTFEHDALAAHAQMLEGLASGQSVEYQLAGQPVVLSREDALWIAREVQGACRQRDLHIARALRRLAEDPPPINAATGRRNLADWAGLKTTAWYTVFSYSSPDPVSPWFCSLDLEAQSLVLLLVAEILESQT